MRQVIAYRPRAWRFAALSVSSIGFPLCVGGRDQDLHHNIRGWHNLRIFLPLRKYLLFSQPVYDSPMILIVPCLFRQRTLFVPLNCQTRERDLERPIDGFGEEEDQYICPNMIKDGFVDRLKGTVWFNRNRVATLVAEHIQSFNCPDDVSTFCVKSAEAVVDLHLCPVLYGVVVRYCR